MNLNLDLNIAKNYKSNSQIARIITENWVKMNSFCPNCGREHLNEFENNKPVADFYCKTCLEEYELKSKNSKTLSKKIVDGAYSSMMARISSNNNPNFFFLTYDKNKLIVINFLIIPKYYFIIDVVEKRKALNPKARRAGWIGCNISLNKIPESGKIYFVKDEEIIPQKDVFTKWKKTNFLKTKKSESKGWILDILNCIEKINDDTFTLSEMYSFENYLKEKYPNNNYIKDKIRQQLQVLRDKGIIQFKTKGVYQKIKYENI